MDRNALPEAMNDTLHIEEISGAAGELAQTVLLCRDINDCLTGLMDRFLGSSDATDAFDASCNTCKYFIRTPFDRKEHLSSLSGFPGICDKTALPVTGWPRGQFCGHACYENRRTGSERTSLGINGSKINHFHNPNAANETHLKST